MWQYGKQIDHYTADQMKTYACQYADQCNADGECTTGCDERRNKPLTKQELIRMWREPFESKDEDSWFVEFARAVERAHGITGETK